MKKMLLVALALLLTACAPGQPDTPQTEISFSPPPEMKPSIAAESYQEICKCVDAVAQKYGAMGMQVAVIEKGTVTQAFSWGWATKDTEPMTRDHKLRVASLSKIVLGIATQLLREEGAISLNQDISDYWEIPVQNPRHPQTPITLENILTHTSSIRAYGVSTSRELQDVKKRLQSGGFTNARPGDMKDWHYNNYAFAVLGMTLELASGETVDDTLRRRLFDTMDIDAAFAGSFLQEPGKIATLYRSDGEIARTKEKQQTMTREERPGATGTYFAGGFLCSAYDFAKLLSLLANDGCYENTQLLERDSVARMEKILETPTHGGSYQGHPMRLWENLYGREKIYFHTGSAYGVYNCASYDPETGDGVVVLTTGAAGSKDQYGIYKVCAELNEFLYPLLQAR